MWAKHREDEIAHAQEEARQAREREDAAFAAALEEEAMQRRAIYERRTGERHPSSLGMKPLAPMEVEEAHLLPPHPGLLGYHASAMELPRSPVTDITVTAHNLRMPPQELLPQPPYLHGPS